MAAPHRVYKQREATRGQMASAGAFKDVILAVVIVGGVLGGLFLYTGVWPPMVVVESGSMMHATCASPNVPDFCDEQVGYGKLGTIDPGDMVFVKHAPKRDDLVTMAEGQAKDANGRNYGSPGDVVVYFPSNIRTRTPIIHRAIAFITVNGVDDPDTCERTGNPGNAATYSVFWEGQTRTFRAGDGGIYLPSMGFGEQGNYRPDNGYKPCWSGFITKGDNPVSNTLPDQALGGGVLPRQPVRMEWIEGKAVGELPWFGLIKLALSSESNYLCAAPNGVQMWRSYEPACDNGKAVRVLNAYAPGDLWVMLGVSLAIIAIAPLAYDMYVLRSGKERAAAVARGETPPPSLGDQFRAWVESLKPKRAPPPPEDGSADPRRAFEPPKEETPAGATKFERVQK